MSNNVKFEGFDRRIEKIKACMAENGIADLEEAKAICEEKGINVDEIVKGVQPIAFDNASWAYTLGVAIAIKKGTKTAAEAADAIPGFHWKQSTGQFPGRSQHRRCPAKRPSPKGKATDPFDRKGYRRSLSAVMPYMASALRKH